MEFRIVYNKSYHSLVLDLEKEYQLLKEMVDVLNIFEIYFENEIIFSNKDNFNKVKINNKFITNKINSFIISKEKKPSSTNPNLDNIDLDEF